MEVHIGFIVSWLIIKKFKKYLNSFGIETDEVHVRNDQYTVFKKYRKKNLKGRGN